MSIRVNPAAARLGTDFRRYHYSRAACARGNSADRAETARRRHAVTTSHELVFLDPVPDAEHKPAARPQHAQRLAIASDLVGEKHRAELAGDDIERRSGNGSASASACRHSTRSAPGWAAAKSSIGWLRSVAIIFAAPGNTAARAARQNPGAGSGFKNPLGRPGRDARRQIGRVGLEDQRPEIAIVEGRDRAGEHGVGSRHDLASAALPAPLSPPRPSARSAAICAAE